MIYKFGVQNIIFITLSLPFADRIVYNIYAWYGYNITKIQFIVV